MDRLFEPGRLLGEPKWLLNGSLFRAEWTRPQDDGPALRASTAAQYARFLQHTYSPYELIYDPVQPSLITTDLAYVMKQWQQSSYEIWEEVRGTHFYTLMAQRRALLYGAQLAERENRTDASARTYRKVARAIKRRANRFWDAKLMQVNCTQNRVAGHDYKDSGLDMQVVLAALHSGREVEGWFDAADPRILATFAKLHAAFRKAYPINRNAQLGVALGRYPEDRYNGYDAAHGGNPWMLLTAAGAELCYRVATAYRHRGVVRVTRELVPFLANVLGLRHLRAGMTVHAHDARFRMLQRRLISAGDKFMARVRHHIERDGNHMAEQWNLRTGKQQGAADLTWSYASYVTAFHAREEALIE